MRFEGVRGCVRSGPLPQTASPCAKHNVVVVCERVWEMRCEGRHESQPTCPVLAEMSTTSAHLREGRDTRTLSIACR